MPTYIPIWRDTFVDLGAVDVATFTVTLDSDQSVLYSGKAVRRPDEATLTVRVNDIVADLISRDLLDLQNPFADYSAFIAGITVSGNGVSVSLSFVNDWSYDRSRSYASPSFILSDPVNGLLDARQMFAVSGVWAGDETVTLGKTDGTSETVSVGITGAGTYVLNLNTVPGLATVTVGERTWTVEGACREWALHYVNSLGGWDSILIRGGGKRVDAITRHDHRKTYDNTLPVHRGRVNYLNEFTTRWELRTGWLSDDESARMMGLTGSTLVYLEEITSGEMLPVVLTDTEQETKTYTNQGRRLVGYTINAELAADRFRK